MQTHQNKSISLTGAQNIIMGAGYADQIDARLNRHLTISWYVGGLPGQVIDAQREVLQLASKWLSYHGVIHVPKHLAKQFRQMVNRWVQRVGADPYAKGAIKMTADKYQRDDNHQSIRHLLRYILKGIDHQAAQLLGITPDYEKAGLVLGKRCGTSQNLGKKARSQNGQLH